jgi:protein O-mannosyl-transferase
MDRMLERRRATGTSVLLGAAALAAFWPVLGNGFVAYDDPVYVTANAHVLGGISWRNLAWAFRSNEASNWHPLTWWSHMLDVQLFGQAPGWHHLVSLLFHIANTILVYVALKRLTGKQWRSAGVAAFFALHPLHVESVAWAAERKDVLSTCFFLLCLTAYVSYAQLSRAEPDRTPLPDHELQATDYRAPKWVWLRTLRTRRSLYLLTLSLFALGLMSKPMLVTVPFVLLLLDHWPLGRLSPSATDSAPGVPPTGRAGPSRAVNARKGLGGPTRLFPIDPGLFPRLVWEKVPFFGLALASCVVTYLVQSGTHATITTVALGPRVANAVASYVKYLAQTIWPMRLAVFYPHPDSYPTSRQWPVWAIAAAAVLLAAVSVLALWRMRRSPWLATGWFWYLGTLVPVIGIVQVGGQAMADRYTYVPLIGIFICIVWGAAEALDDSRAGRAVLAVAAALALTACGVATRNQASYWRNDFALFQHALEVSPDNATAHYHVGVWLRRQGKGAEAAPHFEAVIKSAPAQEDGYYSLAACLELQGKRAEALAMYRSALAVAPRDARIHNDFGALLREAGRPAEAEAQFLEALRINPDYPEALLNLGRALSARGERAAATARFAEAVRLRPDYGEALSHLAESFLEQGREAEAEATYRDWVRRFPGNAQARINLGSMVWRRGSAEEALTQFTEAVRLEPALPLAHFNLGAVLSAQGEFPQAAAEFAAVLRLKPDYLEAFTALGRAMAGQGKFERAQAAFQEAVRLCPTNADLQIYLGGAFMMSGLSNQAAAAFASALRIDPDLAAKSVRAGNSLARRGQTNAALAQLQTALWLRADDADAHESLALLLEHAGKTNEAQAHLREATRLRAQSARER